MQLTPTSEKIKLGCNIKSLSYKQRAQYAHHALSKQLFVLMESKQTNLIHSVDLTTKKEFLACIDAVGPYICAIKTHIDIIVDFDWDLIHKLQILAKKHAFLIIEDRKFCDIGSTVHTQYRDGIYRIVEWADIVIAHAISGMGVINGLKEVGKEKNRGIFLISQLSCTGNLIDKRYTKRAVTLAEQHSDFVIGLIAQDRYSTDPGLVMITPGVNLHQKNDNLSQQYNTPELIIGQRGSDAMIVGRAIYQTDDIIRVAQEYRDAGWNAYKRRLVL